MCINVDEKENDSFGAELVVLFADFMPAVSCITMSSYRVSWINEFWCRPVCNGTQMHTVWLLFTELYQCHFLRYVYTNPRIVPALVTHNMCLDIGR